MRISDWSSDVCSSDLKGGLAGHVGTGHQPEAAGLALLIVRSIFQPAVVGDEAARLRRGERRLDHRIDRKSVVSGKGWSVRVVLGGRRILKKKKKNNIVL